MNDNIKTNDMDRLLRTKYTSDEIVEELPRILSGYIRGTTDIKTRLPLTIKRKLEMLEAINKSCRAMIRG